jgi:hypothetical protein
MKRTLVDSSGVDNAADAYREYLLSAYQSFNDQLISVLEALGHEKDKTSCPTSTLKWFELGLQIADMLCEYEATESPYSQIIAQRSYTPPTPRPMKWRWANRKSVDALLRSLSIRKNTVYPRKVPPSSPVRVNKSTNWLKELPAELSNWANIEAGLKQLESIAREASELPAPLNALEKRILKALDGKALKKATLARAAKGDGGRLSKALTTLRVQGRVLNQQGLGYYRPDALPTAGV